MDEFIEKIKLAFAGVEYPGDDNLIADADHRAKCDECQLLYDRFRGVRWEQASDNIQWLGHLAHAKSFFTVAAWHYYLPAVLIQRYCRHAFSSSEFAPSTLPLLFEYERAREAILTSAQCSVLIEFMKVALAYFRGHDDAYFCQQRALAHWEAVLATKGDDGNRAG
jgi:hypothetical protein